MKEEEEIDTIFDTKEVNELIEDAESDGVLEAAALEARAAELGLDEEDLALLRVELEARGVELTALDERADATDSETRSGPGSEEAGWDRRLEPDVTA
jgi:hypothetical protein